MRFAFPIRMAILPGKEIGEVANPNDLSNSWTVIRANESMVMRPRYVILSRHVRELIVLGWKI